jgi:hypothetical protein
VTAAVFPVSVAAYVVLVVLALAVTERVVAPRALPAALVAHGVVPRRATGPLAVAVTVAEAASLVLGVVTGPRVLFGTALLFAAYGGYAWYVTASGRGGPCGCGGADVPMDHWVTGRAGVLAALAVLGAVAGDRVLPLRGVDSRLVVILLAATTIGLLLWHLPAAMARPEEALP